MLWGLGALFTIWMAVEAFRRGQTMPWLWIVLFFGPLGATVYFVLEMLPALTRGGGLRASLPGAGRRVGRGELRRLAEEAQRLDKADTWVEYAAALNERGQRAEAAEAARRAVEREPGNRHARMELGTALLATGQPEEAARYLDGLEEPRPGFDSALATYSLAQARLELGELSEARELLEGLGQRSSRPEFLLGLAAVQSRDGDLAAARATLERIIDEARTVPRFARGNVRPWVRKAKQALKRLA